MTEVTATATVAQPKPVTPKVTVKPQKAEPADPAVSAATRAEMEAGRRALEKRKAK